MRKPLPLLLSAVLAFGSVFTTSAAPLLKKACADNSPRGEVLGARVDDPSLSSPKRIDPSSRLAKRLPSGNVEGLMRVESPTRLKNTKALKSATSARRALGADIDLRGVVLSFVNSALYRLPKATGEDMTLLKQFEAQYQFGAIDDGNGHFHGVNYTQYGPWTYITLETYDTSTWELISSTPDLGYEVCSTAAALDPVSGDIYGCFYADEGDYLKYVWAKADYENFTSIPIADMEVDLVGLGADNRGQYYGIGTDAILYKIDKNTGEMEALAPVDVPTQSPFASGCVNTSNNTFLQTYASPGGQTGGSGLVEIDLETGETTRLLEFSGNKEVMGLHIAEPLAREKAPAAPGISVSCENGSMEARITLTMPETLVDGTPATAQTFSYSVMAQGEEVMAG